MLEQVMREGAPRLLAYAAMLTGDDAEAHDVVQDALVRSFSRGRVHRVPRRDARQESRDLCDRRQVDLGPRRCND
jgi:DNA-directed RNA polymerase specialized sigma24 family protein